MTGSPRRASGAEVACCSFGAVGLVGGLALVLLLRVANSATDPSSEDAIGFVGALAAAAVVAVVGALGALLALVVHLLRHGPALRPVTWVLGLLPALGGAVFAVDLLPG